MTYYPHLAVLVLTPLMAVGRSLNQGSTCLSVEPFLFQHYPSSTRTWGLGAGGPTAPLCRHPQTTGGKPASPALLSLGAARKEVSLTSHLRSRPRSIRRKYKPSCHLTHNKYGPSSGDLNGRSSRGSCQTSKDKGT